MEKLIRSKFFWSILVCVFIFCFSLFYCSKTNIDIELTETENLQKKNDSLQFVVDSLDRVLLQNQMKYEAIVDSIRNQSVDDDCDFFSNWISKKCW